MKLTLNQRRFLIIWILFHSFALFVNLADIRGTIDNSDTSYNSYGYLVHNGTDRTIYLFTNSSGQNKSDFWPFTSYYTSEPKTTDSLATIPLNVDTTKEVLVLEDGTLKYVPRNNPPKSTSIDYNYRKFANNSPIIKRIIGYSYSFGGLFNSYGLPEYIFYILLGLAIIFVPKLWK